MELKVLFTEWKLHYFQLLCKPSNYITEFFIKKVQLVFFLQESLVSVIMRRFFFDVLNEQNQAL